MKTDLGIKIKFLCPYANSSFDSVDKGAPSKCSTFELNFISFKPWIPKHAEER